ncbi:MAG: aminotransferase class V-fold PLP-dependent enzyme [Legionellaceae bacterium]|nr:aminotransferase class V-fold PLP-dependent enzyme [Legionellaceae bacterium]
MSLNAPRPIYLDYMATTPVDPKVIDAMLPFLGPDGAFGNAHSPHQYGQTAAAAVEEARARIAETLSTSAESLIFTSGATEANNLAIIGAARLYQRKGRHIITMATEHPSVLESMEELSREGFEISYLPPQADGLLDLELLRTSLRKDTILVSIMHANNEIGVIQDIPAIAELLQGKGILFHVDAAQSAGKIAIDLEQWPIHLLSLSAHKNYGPKGIGALYIRQRPRIRVERLTFGGNQERGFRSGTLPVHQIVGMGAAFNLSQAIRIEEQARLLELRQQLWTGIQDLPHLQMHGHPTQRLAGNLHISFEHLEGHTLRERLPELALSSTSACSTTRHGVSTVLTALGISKQRAQNAVRLSLGRFTSENDIQCAILAIRRAAGDSSCLL